MENDEKVKKRLEVFDDGEEIKIDFVPGENNTVVDMLGKLDEEGAETKET